MKRKKLRLLATCDEIVTQKCLDILSRKSTRRLRLAILGRSTSPGSQLVRSVSHPAGIRTLGRSCGNATLLRLFCVTLPESRDKMDLHGRDVSLFYNDFRRANIRPCRVWA